MIATSVWNFYRPFLVPYKNRLIALAIFPAIWCLIETIAPFLIRAAIDHLATIAPFSAKAQAMLVYIILAYATLMLMLEIATRSCNYVWIKTFPKIRAAIQSKALEHIQSQDYKFFCNQLSGELLSKYRNLSSSFENISKSLLYGFYPTVLSFLFALIFITYINIFFAVIFSLWFLAMNIVTITFFQKSILASQEQSKDQNRNMGYIGDFVSNAIMLMAYPRSLHTEDRFLTLQEKCILSTQRSEFVTFKADTWRSFFSWILLAGMISFLGFGWQRHWVTLGDFSFIAAVCFYVRRSIWMMSVQLSDFFKEIGMVKEAISLILEASQHSKNVDEQESRIPMKNTLDFSGIRFGYTKDSTILNNLTLQIPPAQKLGIYGSSGVGKTSLIHLLLRLYDPEQGTILFNGEDYKDLPVAELRNYFSYVPQNPMLLHCSIFDNIAFGKASVSKEEVYEAAHICLCAEFIDSLEYGYDTVVGEGGYKLSGGQRQRIAIARAYLKKAPVFVLDEATSGLDPQLEEKLFNQLFDKLKEHTLILISHRISSLQRMERVVELKHGQIIENVLQREAV